MRRAALFVILLAGCRTVPVSTTTSTSTTGADNGRAVIERFLNAAKAQDMQALAAAWGNNKGSIRDFTDRATLEKQSLIALKCLRHDQATIGAPSRGTGETLRMVVEMTQGSSKATPWFDVVKGPSNRWYVENFEIVMLQNKGFC